MRIEIRPGEGGDDANVFCRELADALTAFAKRNGWTVQPENHPDNRTIAFTVRGTRAVLDELEPFAGTHRIQRVPSNDKHGRRQTSTAVVAVLDGTQPREVQLRDKDLRVDFFRGTGPGGQHRNKTSTAVRLTHLPTGIVVTRTSGRSQADNLASAREDLRGRLQARADEASATRVQDVRRAQAGGDGRSAKSFTHNTQRDVVVDHRTGKTWTLRAWAQGRLA